MARGFLTFLDKYPNHNNPFACNCHVKCPGNTVLADHAHFPQGAFQMLYMRLPDFFKPYALDKKSNTANFALISTGKASNSTSTVSFRVSTVQSINLI